MQKILAYLVLLLLPLVARGQALSDWYYWFDTDKVPQKSGQVSDQKFHLEADVSNLTIGAHTLFVQVADTAGVYSPPIGTWFYHVPDTKNMDKLYYWMGDENVMHSVDFGNGKFELDVSGIPTGMHALNLQLTDKNGSVSAVNTYLFYKVPVSAKIQKLRYWIDGMLDIKELAYGQNNFLLDVSDCTPGFHFIYYYAVDGDGRQSAVQSAGFYRVPMASSQRLYYWFAGDSKATEVKDFAHGFVADVSHVQEGFNTLYIQMVDHGPAGIEALHFIKVPQTEGNGDLTVACIIDGKLAAEQKVSCHGGVMKLDMDVSNIEVGMHKAMFQVITPTGAGSSIAETYFIRTLTNDDVASMQCSYTIDGFKHYTHKGTLTNGTFHFDLPVDEVEDGLHRIDFMLVAENGATTTQGNAWFFKTPVGGNAIKQYDYWLNDKSDEVHSVTLDEPKDPFQLIKLLPVESEPIRSSCFHFEVKDGKPMMYAKNDIHFRFHDKSGRWVDADKQYVDYNAGKSVEKVKQLTLDMATENLDKPQENVVTWYSIECEKGDSLSLKLSQPATVQVFSALGKELLNVSGSESVKMSGVRLKDNGTYYIAIHDVTGSNSKMTMDYLRVGKFTLLASSNRVLGALPAVQILSLEGNGFDNLKNVSLKLGNQILTADSIAHVSNQTARLYWLFDGKEQLGDYDLSLHFDDGEEQRDIVKSKFVTLAKPSFDDITVEISDPRRVADPYPVYIKVTNNSNIAYQAIPFYFAIDHIDRIQSVKYMDFAVGCSKELYEAGLKLNFEYDSFEGNNSKTRVVPTIIPELLPGETKTFTLGVKTGNHQIFNVYAWTGRPWSLLLQETKEYIIANYAGIQKTRGMKKASGVAGIFDGCSDDPCDLAGNKLSECVCGTSLALGGTLGGIQNALLNMNHREQRKMMAQSGLFSEPYSDLEDQFLPSPEDLLWYWLQHCIPGKAGQATSIYNSQRQMLGNDPCQNPEPHPVNPYNPGDPNEMHGTVSESGCKYIKQDITDITYSIEFENDPELANASAHKIVVCDTLDANIFDMSSFKPTSVKIGNKSVELDGSQNSIQTLDMRPEIYAIAQVKTEFNQNTGVAKWTISSLDPMTMEETFDIMQGILPVNNGGNGVGFINYEVGLKSKLNDGDSFSNRASIVFDFEDPILTPTWTNTIDAVPPTSSITNVLQQSDTIATIYMEGKDSRSGVWKYDVYVQYGEDAPWVKMAECGADSGHVDFRYYDGMDYGFCVIATDSAGNVEQKELTREGSLVKVNLGDVNCDGEVNTLDVSLTTAYYLEQPVYILTMAADVNADGEINTLDATQITQMYLRANVAPRGTMRVAPRQRLKTTKTTTTQNQ